MKTSNVSSVSPTVDVSACKAGTAPAEGAATDFLALFAQLVSAGTQNAAAPANAVAAGVKLGADAEQDADGELDNSDLAMLMAALAAANSAPPVVATPAMTSGNGAIDLPATAVKTGELAGTVLNAMATQAEAGAETGSTLETGFDALLTGTDSNGNAMDPRASQSAVDALRDPRAAQQTEAPVQRSMHTPVGTRAWENELGTQINWMTERGHQAASLRLSPEHLGPLEVRISIKDDQASVWFGAAHADTRAAIESALPRLREMMASQGLALNDAGVFKEPPQQQPHARIDRGNGSEANGGTEELQSVTVSRLGLVDAYA